MRTRVIEGFALAVLMAVATATGIGSEPARAAAQAGSQRDACRTVQRALDSLSDSLRSTESQLSDQFRERNVLDALINRMQGQTLGKAALTAAMNEVSGGEVVPQALRQWASALDGSVSPQTVAGRRASTQARIEHLTDQQKNAEAQVRQLRQKQVELDCPMVGGSTPGAPGAGPTAPVPGTSRGPTVPTTSAGASGTTTAPAEIEVSPNDWKGDWTHDFGLLTLELNTHADQVGYIADEQLGATNAMGTAVVCDRKGLYRGEIQWDRAGGGFNAGYRGKVFACTNGNTLEGKFSNYGEGAATVQSASFTLTMAADDKKSFAGQFRAYNPAARSSGSAVSWSGKR